MNPYRYDAAPDRNNWQACGDVEPVPLDYHGVLIEGPHWARLLVSVAALLAPVGRLLDRVLVTAFWAGLPLVGGLVITGHAHQIGLSDTPTGIRPFYLVVASVGALIIGVIAADVIRYGRINKTTRTGHDPNRHQIVNPVILPDDPNLHGRNGYTPPGTPDSTWGDR
jgi:hypothetical protein